MKDLHEGTVLLFGEAQSLVDVAPHQDGLDVDPVWVRRERRRQLDRQRKQDARDTAAILEELRAKIAGESCGCACGCGEPVQGRGKYASDECRERVRRERDRERKAAARAEALRQIREAEGIAEWECPVCGVWFPVELSTPGRPREFCSVKCRVLAAVRAWRNKRSTKG